MEIALQPFYNAIEKNDFEHHSKNLLDVDITACASAAANEGKIVLVFEGRKDIAAFCRHEEKRMEWITGHPRKIRDDRVAAVFRWKKSTGMVWKQPFSEESWLRFFKIDTTVSCLVCMEFKDKKSICCNCTSIVCFECRDKLKDDTCPGCTVKLDFYRVY